MTRQHFTTIGFLALNVLLQFGCGSKEASTCAPDSEHSHEETAGEEAESCEPGKNCMCPGGGMGTSVCDVATEAFVECDCTKGMANASAAGKTATTTSAATGAAGMTAAASAAAGSSAGAAGMTAAASAAAGSSSAAAAGASAAAAGASAAAAGSKASAAAGSGAAGATAGRAGAAGR